MTANEKLINNLKNLIELAQQVQQGTVSNIALQQSHPERIENAERLLRIAQAELKLIREEDEVGVAYWREIEDAYPIIIDRLNNRLQMDMNLDFMQATDRKHLKKFLTCIIMYGLPLLQEAVENLSDEDRHKLLEAIT